MLKTQNPSIVFATIALSDLDLIDFSQIQETSAATTSTNLAQDQAMIAWELGKVPTVIGNGQVQPLLILNHEEAVALIHGPLWSEPFIEQP